MLREGQGHQPSLSKLAAVAGDRGPCRSRCQALLLSIRERPAGQPVVRNSPAPSQHGFHFLCLQALHHLWGSPGYTLKGGRQGLVIKPRGGPWEKPSAPMPPGRANLCLCLPRQKPTQNRRAGGKEDVYLAKQQLNLSVTRRRRCPKCVCQDTLAAMYLPAMSLM